ncbi:MAG: hypothetical protein COT34_01895 [Candidatus Nealsonbacteria bacterium CG08_land_8_20_14_0_20_43_11]|uniref:Uncharacterized protein n=1 Tax=Candidatus Nealsonbacteria bacterium CG08_land_8_20_14_0_20_43_11 TaxID=1974706 RepID=A0A2M6T0S4_9BACT|nr:MAG: hypothetical protein COT34_01895 [Candidatus Nealsonbacteria bacterium CG08_land_8_20_14_0_20_43_11]
MEKEKGKNLLRLGAAANFFASARKEGGGDENMKVLLEAVQEALKNSLDLNTIQRVLEGSGNGNGKKK